MRDLSFVQKLSLQDGLVYGPAKAFPILKVEDGVGLRIGISEFAVGEHKMDLTYAEVLYILEGEIFLEADGNSHLLKVGDFFWMPAHRKIAYRAEQACKFLYVIPEA